MAKKKNTIPSEFDDLLGNIYSNAEGTEEVTDIDQLDQLEDVLVEDKNDNEPPVKNPEDGKTADQIDDPNAHEDTTEEPPVQNNQEDEKQEEDITQENIIEAEQVGLLFDAIGTSLGWNLNEIDEKDRPLTVDELTQYFTDVVNQNSIPTYADERIQALDEYVKNGGRFEDFYAKQQEALTLDSIDLEDENNQKAVVREFMRYNGYKDDQINKRIARFEDADMLYDEAEDALGRLKEIRQTEVEAAEQRQYEQAVQEQERSMQFVQDVSNQINSLTDIRGVAVPKEDRKALLDYIFKVDQNGQSQYMKDFYKNLSKNLIESAYFTMKADSIISTAKKDGESSAAEKLRKLLRHSTKNHSTYNVDNKQKSVTDLINGMF